MSKYSPVFFIFMILILTLFMLLNPRETVLAASSGIKLWYTTVLPALLPFFIVAELLVSLRFVNFIGIILEPVMRPLFRLPGCSSLVVVLGFTSGFPVGALLTRRLYDDRLLTASEAERLASFTNNSSPLFILGAVGIGMFANPSAGYLLAAAHYLSNLCLGFLWRWKADDPEAIPAAGYNLWLNAVKTLHAEKSNSIGKIMGDAVRNSLNNILAVGGFIVLFSVITRMLTYWGFMDWIANGLMTLLAALDLSYPLAYSLGMGIFEMTLGTQTAATSADTGLLPQMLAVSAILSFSGLSIIAQVMSILAGTPVRLSFYLFSRLVQIIIACILTAVLYHSFFRQSLEAFSLPVYKVLYSFNAWTVSLACMLAAFFLIFFTVMGVLYCKYRA